MINKPLLWSYYFLGGGTLGGGRLARHKLKINDLISYRGFSLQEMKRDPSDLASAARCFQVAWRVTQEVAGSSMLEEGMGH